MPPIKSSNSRRTSISDTFPLNETTKLPRATIKQKIQVLDFLKGPPRQTQNAALQHFQSLHQFAISQATLSNWVIKEKIIREQYSEHPNLNRYKRLPILKYPDVTKAVEDYLENINDPAITITDQLIKDIFCKYVKEFGYEKDFKLSGGMLQSFKKRNFITRGKFMNGSSTAVSTSELSNGSIRDQNRVSVNLSEHSTPPSIMPTPTSIEQQQVIPSNNIPQPQQQAHTSSSPSSHDLDIDFDEIFNNPNVGFNTRLIHSDDNFNSFLRNFGSNQQSGLTPVFLNEQQPLMDIPIQQYHEQNSLSQEPQIPQQSQHQIQSEPVVPPKSKQLPYYPTYSDPLQPQPSIQQQYQQTKPSYTLENFAYSRTTHPNSEKVEKILQNIISDHYVTLYNSGTSAIMGILSYLNPPKICINNSGYQGSHRVIKLLSKLTGLEKLSLEETDKLVPGSVILIESPMNPEGYLLPISKYAGLAHKRKSYLLVDSTLAPPPLQNPFKYGADYTVYSAVKYLAGVSDLSAGFVVTKKLEDKQGLSLERSSLGTSIAGFDSFLLLRSLRTFKMRILTQCGNTEKVVKFLSKNLSKYQGVVSKLHHSSLQETTDAKDGDGDDVRDQLNGYYNPVFAVEFTNRHIAESVLKKFNFLSNNPLMEGGETLVELTFKNPNFGIPHPQEDRQNKRQQPPNSRDNATSNGGVSGGGSENGEGKSDLLRFSIGCEDYEDIIRDIDQAFMCVVKREKEILNKFR